MRIFTEEDTALVIDLGAGVDVHGLKYWETKFDAFLAAYPGNKVISAKMLDNKWEELCRHFDRDDRNTAWVQALLKAGYHEQVTAFEASRGRKKALSQQKALRVRVRSSGPRARPQRSGARAHIQRSTARVIGHFIRPPRASATPKPKMRGAPSKPKGPSGGSVESAMPAAEDGGHVNASGGAQSSNVSDHPTPSADLSNQDIYYSSAAPPRLRTVAELAITHMEQNHMNLLLQHLSSPHHNETFNNLVGEHMQDGAGGIGPTYAEIYLSSPDAHKPLMIIEWAAVARARWDFIAQERAGGW